MMKNKKGLFISIAVIIIIIIVTVFTIIEAKSKATDTDILEEKVNAEINFLDDKILSMLNSLNNILLRNYVVNAEQVGQSTEESDTEKSGVSKNSDETQVESDKSSSDNKTKTNMFELKNAGILSTEKEPDWATLKNEIEILYSSWSTIILDLYKVNINSADILKFSELLDKATINIKSEDKTKSLASLADLYSCLPIYIQGYSKDDKQINLQRTKSSLINAYALVDIEKWDEVNTQISNAELSYLNVLNSVSKEENYDINRGYILLKELQNSLSQKDKDIFYIKYKNLLELLNDVI